MSSEEQAQRMIGMQKRIKKYDVTHWADDFLTQLDHVQQRSDKLNITLLDEDTKTTLLDQFARAANRLLLLDYDGTLVQFVSSPEQAAPDGKLLGLLESLSSDPLNTVFIISGRDRRSLDKWLGHLELNLVAEHGAWIRYAGQDWETASSVKIGWMEPARLIFNQFTRRSRGSFIENKTYSMAWHYRKVDESIAATQSAELLNEINELAENWGIDVINGNKVIEIRNKGNNKGIAVGNIMRNREFDFIFAAGDDTTDEDMFSQLSATANAFTFKVGLQSSYAHYNIPDTLQLASLLTDLGNSSLTPPAA